MNTKKIKDARAAIKDLELALRLGHGSRQSSLMMGATTILEEFIKWAEAEHATNVQNAARMRDSFFKNHPGAADMTKTVQEYVSPHTAARKLDDAHTRLVDKLRRDCARCGGTGMTRKPGSHLKIDCPNCGEAKDPDREHWHCKRCTSLKYCTSIGACDASESREAGITPICEPEPPPKPATKAATMKAAEAMVAPVKADERICYYCKGTKRLQSLVNNTTRECVYCAPC